MKKIVVVLMIMVVYLSGSIISYADEIIPSIQMAKSTSAYEKISIEVDRLDITEIQMKLLENRMDSSLKGINRMISFGYESLLDAKFNLVYNRDMAMPNFNYMEESLLANQKIIQNTMYVAVRNLYSGLYSTQNLYELGIEKYNLESEKFDVIKMKYENGLISDIDYKKAEYELLAAKIDFMEVEDNYKEMLVNFNNFIGNDNLYEEYILTDELIVVYKFDSTEEQIQKALENRSEIVDLMNQIELKNIEKEIFESRGGSYLIFPKIELDYNKLLIEMVKLDIELNETKKSIEVEIEKDINELKALENNLDTMTDIYDNQINNLEKFQLQNELGYISDQMYKEIEIEILKFEVNYQLAIQNYNTQILSHHYALNIGPSCEGGGF